MRSQTYWCPMGFQPIAKAAVELARSGNQGSQVGLSTDVHDGESSNVVDGLADLGQLLAAVRADRC